MGASRSLTLATAALLIGGCMSNRDSSDLGTREGPQQDTIESTSPVLAIRFSEDSRYLAHLTRDGMSLWDVLHEENTSPANMVIHLFIKYFAMRKPLSRSHFWLAHPSNSIRVNLST